MIHQTWLQIVLIVGANLIAFAWGMRQWQLRDREQAREKFMALVREWDKEQRENGYAIERIEYKPEKLGFWLRCTATWRSDDGKHMTASKFL